MYLLKYDWLSPTCREPKRLSLNATSRNEGLKQVEAKSVIYSINGIIKDGDNCIEWMPCCKNIDLKSLIGEQETGGTSVNNLQSWQVDFKDVDFFIRQLLLVAR